MVSLGFCLWIFILRDFVNNNASALGYNCIHFVCFVLPEFVDHLQTSKQTSQHFVFRDGTKASQQNQRKL